MDDNLPRMNVWLLQDSEKADLLKTVIRADYLAQTCALIVLDLDQPWDLMNQLYKWLAVIRESIQSILSTLSLA